MREIVLDTETTGLKFTDNHRVIEIAAIEIIDFLPTGKVFHKYVNPQRDVPESSVDIHGITEKFLSNKPLFKDIVEEFLEFVSSDNIVAHNAPFDIGFLNFELQKCGKNILLNRSIDTVVLAREKFPGQSVSLDALCKRYRVDNSRRTQHTALIDCDLLAKVYVNLIDQKEPTLNFQNQDLQKYDKNTEKVLYYKKIMSPTDKEIIKHKQFLSKNLKKNFF